MNIINLVITVKAVVVDISQFGETSAESGFGLGAHNGRLLENEARCCFVAYVDVYFTDIVIFRIFFIHRGAHYQIGRTFNFRYF